MLRTALTLPVLTVLGLVAALVGSGISPAAAQEVASLTVYLTECPAGFAGEDQADLYAVCYGNPVAGQSFSAQQGKSTEVPALGTTDEAGLVDLPLYGGATTISEGLPQGIGEYFVFCSHEDGSPVEFEYTGDTFGIFLEEEGGDYYPNGSHVHCDWYNVPAANGDDGDAGTLSIYRVACPPGYAGDAYYEDCYDNPTAGAEFSIHQQGTDVGVGFTTGPDGAARSGLLLATPGTLVVAETTGSLDDGQPIDYLDYVVVCTRNGGEPVEIDYGQPNVMDVVFAADPEDAIVCDWFYVPPASEDDGGADGAEGSLTIYATACPPGYAGNDFYPDCYDDPAADLVFAAWNTKSDFEVAAPTDGGGFVTLTLPAEDPAGGLIDFGQAPPVEVAGGADAPFVVYCTTDGGESVVDVAYSLVQLDPGGDAYHAEIAYAPGDEIRCDWYR
jgi:hypothetical protein